MSQEALRHQEFAANFASVAEALSDWDAPTPVKEWRARNVVEHLLEWLPPVLDRWTGVTLPPVDAHEPAENWVKRSRDVQHMLEDPGTAAREVNSGPFEGQPLSQVVDRIYTADIYMHTWDLARAGNVDVTMDPQYAQMLLAGMRPMESVLRESGQYGPATHTDSTDPVDRLMAFIGRAV